MKTEVDQKSANLPTSLEINLAGVRYRIPPLTLRQHLKIPGALREPHAMFGVLHIAFERAEPSVDMNETAPAFEELVAAFNAIMKFAGLAPPAAA